MRLTIRAHPGARVERTVRTGPAELELWIRAPARDGLANAAIERQLARLFRIPIAAVRVVRGRTGRSKLIDVDSLTPDALERLNG